MAETKSSSSTDTTTSSSAGTPTARQLADLEQQRKNANQQIRPQVEEQRQQAEQVAQNALDSEAIAAIQQTERALVALAEDRTDEALAAIEQATGKINILLSRNPATALIPVNAAVTVIDTAPEDIGEIALLRDAAEIAVDTTDLPAARTLLDALRSEIRVRTYNLPLATYPTALQEAARLIDEKNTDDAAAVLLVALNTLAIIDQVIPLPLLLARVAVDVAQDAAPNDKDAAQKLLDTANHELERAMELGYTPETSEYNALRDDIKTLRKQLKTTEETGSLFKKLKDKLAALTSRRSEKPTRSNVQQQAPKAA